MKEETEETVGDEAEVEDETDEEEMKEGKRLAFRFKRVSSNILKRRYDLI